MIARSVLLVAALAGLAACQPAVPDSARGVGFDNSVDAQIAREAALAQSRQPLSQPQTIQPPVAVEAMPLGAGVIIDDGSPAATAAETQRILEATRPGLSTEAAVNSGIAPLQPNPVSPPPVTLNNPGISDENDFAAVAERETIASDKARIEANRAQYEVIQPEALPNRPGDTQPNIVAYALQTSNPVGQQIYRRSGLSGAGRAARNCGKYPSPDLAQADFLARGGPERDGKGLDPDGDGYACDWDPSPFRKSEQQG